MQSSERESVQTVERGLFRKLPAETKLLHIWSFGGRREPGSQTLEAERKLSAGKKKNALKWDFTAPICVEERSGARVTRVAFRTGRGLRASRPPGAAKE